MRVANLTHPELIFPHLAGSDRPTVLRAFADRLAEISTVNDADDLYRRLIEREDLSSTGIGSGVAIPHCKMNGLSEVVVAIGLCEQPVDFDAPDDEPVDLLFLLVSPEDAPAEHLQSLSAISKWVKANRHVEKIRQLDDAGSIYELLERETD
jgi:PTS system nitrogen regulatory IIA component